MEFRVLGPLEVVSRGGVIAIGSVQQRRALAALLAAGGAVVSADALVDVLWGEEPPVSALKTLHSHVSRRRSLLGPAGRDVLVTKPPGYVLHADRDAVDARRFERLVSEARATRPNRPLVALYLLDQALALWRGSALAEFAHSEWA